MKIIEDYVQDRVDEALEKAAIESAKNMAKLERETIKRVEKETRERIEKEAKKRIEKEKSNSIIILNKKGFTNEEIAETINVTTEFIEQTLTQT